MREKEFDKQQMERFLLIGVQTSKEGFIHLLSRMLNLLEFHVSSGGQFHNVPSSVSWISLPFNEPSLLENIEECYHIGTINRKTLRQVLLGCLANGFEKKQNPIVRGIQFPGTEDLCKLTTSFSSQTAQHVGWIGEKALWYGMNTACIQRFLIVQDSFPVSRVFARVSRRCVVSFCTRHGPALFKQRL
jgi:hypothetical protein